MSEYVSQKIAAVHLSLWEAIAQTGDSSGNPRKRNVRKQATANMWLWIIFVCEIVKWRMLLRAASNTRN
jgi:hypothetical protein